MNEGLKSDFYSPQKSVRCMWACSWIYFYMLCPHRFFLSRQRLLNVNVKAMRWRSNRNKNQTHKCERTLYFKFNKYSGLTSKTEPAKNDLFLFFLVFTWIQYKHVTLTCALAAFSHSVLVLLSFYHWWEVDARLSVLLL